MGSGWRTRPRAGIILGATVVLLVRVFAAAEGPVGAGPANVGEVPSYAAPLADAEIVDPGTAVTEHSRNMDGQEPAPYRTAPPDLPRFVVKKGSGLPGAGYIFMSPFDFTRVGSSPAYLLILDNNAEPVYYHRFDRLPNAMDFKKQANGLLTYYDRIQGLHIALNNQYGLERTYAPGNGYTADLHDLQILENGHALFLIYDLQVVDMSEIVEGGQPDALVTGCIIQETDAQGNVVFEWRSWDHINILDSTRDFTAKTINYMNCNSIAEDNDGHLLLSSRNLDEITKINRETGEIIWRMGGKKNEFNFLNGGNFYRQHDARRLANGHLTYYDNGVFHNPPHSRGLEVIVDERNKTVTVVREFRNIPDAYAGAMGNVQRLPGGNTVIGWGRSSNPVYTEFDPQGVIVQEFAAIRDIGSYRVFRSPWQGYPYWAPVLMAQAQEHEVELFFSWNGSTETSAYMVFATQQKDQDWHVATVAKQGFETSSKFTVPKKGLWEFWVVAVDKEMQPLGTSNRFRLLIGGVPVYFPHINGGQAVYES